NRVHQSLDGSRRQKRSRHSRRRREPATVLALVDAPGLRRPLCRSQPVADSATRDETGEVLLTTVLFARPKRSRLRADWNQPPYPEETLMPLTAYAPVREKVICRIQ